MKLHIEKSCHFMFVLIVLLFLSSMVFAQTRQVNFRHLTSSDGLSQNRIFDIAQDQDGFIWIGTEDGLNRYDGYNFETFKTIPGDSNSLADNFATVLLVANDGTLWSGGNFGGLSRFNAESNNFNSYSHIHSDPYSLADNYIISLSENENGNLWIGTNNNGFDYMIVKEGKFIHMQNMLPKNYPLQSDEVNFVYEDGLNHLWVGGGNKVHYFKLSYNDLGIPQLQPIVVRNQVFKNYVNTIEESNDKQIWIGTEGEGLWKFDRDNLSLSKVQFENDYAAANSIHIQALESDGKGNIWIGGLGYSESNGIDFSKTLLYKLDTTNGYLQKFNLDPKNEPGLRTNGVLSIHADRTGVIWIGTGLGGVRIYDESLTKFNAYLANPNDNSKFSNAIRGFYLDQEDLLWIATQGDGLVSYDRKSESVNFYKNNRNDPASISSNFATEIYNDGEYLWIGTFNGLNRFDKKTNKFKSFFVGENSEGFRVNYNILEIDKFPGYLWFGTNGNGLVKFNKNDFTAKQYTYDPLVDNGLDNRANFVRFVWYSDKRPNEIWMGTTNGINILNLDTETFRSYTHDPNDSTSISHPNVMHFYEDDEGFVWVSTYGGGLNRFDPATEKFLRFTEGNSNIPNNGVYGALPDKNGFLWISTNNGITKFDPKTFEFRNYTVDDGLQSEEFNGGSYHLAHNGEMFFGGIKGFNSFIPEEVSDNKYIPNIVITDFKIFNESIHVGENSPLKQEITKTSEIILEYWQNDILFEYVALHYSNPTKNKYAFKLDNYEDQWRYVGNTRIATYTNLDPGEYIFKVKGSNNDGLWNEEGKSIRLIINPPWWKTNLAYASYAFLFLFGLFSVDRFQKVRIKRLEQRKAQLALLQAENQRKTEELEEARNLQLSMLPKSLPQVPHLDIAVYMKTATEVGGDYYDFHVHLDGTLTVVLGDATGHGMMSGMMVSIMKSLFMADRSSKELKSFFNNSSQAIKDMQLNRLMMALTCIQFKGNTIRIANAGMPSLYMYRNRSAELLEIAVNDLPLGAMREYDYEVREEIVEKGDALLMMSDGFAELTNSSDEMIGYTRTAKLFEEAAAKSPEDIVAYLNKFGSRWTDHKEPDDDVTFVVIKVK